MIPYSGVLAVVLDYRGAERTVCCLESLKAQGLAKVILVDNSGDENSSRELDCCVSAMGWSEDWLQLVRPKANLGFAGGVNLAIATDMELGGHTHYLLMNNDAVAPPGLVARLVEVLEASPSLAAVAPMLRGGTGQESPVIWYNRYLGILTRKSTPLSFPYLCGCCVLLKASVVKDGRLFDPAFFMYGEDVDLGWRIRQSGLEVASVEDVEILHEAGASSRKGQLFYEFSLARTHLQLVPRTCTILEAPLALITKVFVLLVRAFVRSARYRSVVPLQAFFFSLFRARAMPPCQEATPSTAPSQ